MILFNNNTSINRKLLFVYIATTGFSLLFALSILMYVDALDDESKMLQSLNAVADVVAGESVAALSFEDAQTANKNLQSLKYYESIVYACIRKKDNELFAKYISNMKANFSCSEYDASFKHEATGVNVDIYKPIMFSGEVIGRLQIKASLQGLLDRTIEIGVVFSALFVVIMLISTIASKYFTALIIDPIAHLKDTALRIADSEDHSLRVQKKSNDEVGLLIDAFNHMLDHVEKSDAEFIKQKEKSDVLARKAREGAIKVKSINGEMEREIKERIKAEYELQELNDTLEEKVNERTLELKELNKKIGSIARSAGMAEMASGVLHNVSNVLNSVNVSTSVVREMLRKTKAENLTRVVDMLEENKSNIAEYMSKDERGTQIPRFLTLLSIQLEKERAGMFDELDSLSENVEHIKNVIGMQQSYAGSYGVRENVALSDLVEDSIRLNIQGVDNSIEIIKKYRIIPQLNIDKHKVLQVIINLISNAKNALLESAQENKKIMIDIDEQDGFSRLEIKDTGIGIDAEDLEYLFEYGFKKRRAGHGFGLHHSLMVVNELGGQLFVKSDGLGKGASFILLLPFSDRGDV